MGCGQWSPNGYLQGRGFTCYTIALTPLYFLRSVDHIEHQVIEQTGYRTIDDVYTQKCERTFKQELTGHRVQALMSDELK